MLDLKHTHRGIKLNIRSIFRLFVNKGTLVGALNIRLIHSYIIFVSNKIIYRYFISRKYITIIPLLNYISTKKGQREISNLMEERIQITLSIFFPFCRRIKMSILKGKTTNPFPSKNYANTRFLLQQLPSNSHSFNLFSSTPENPRTTRFQNSCSPSRILDHDKISF